MPKYKALEMCVIPGKGRMVPAFDNGSGKQIWPGDVEELPEEVGAAFGPKHLKRVNDKSKVRRWDVEKLKGGNSKTMGATVTDDEE